MISRHHLPLSRCLILYITMLAGLVSSLQDATSSSLRGVHENERLLQKTVNGENESFSELQLEYFETCTETFLSDKVVGDGIISQNDFTEHLVQFCETYSAPEMTEFPFQCPDNSFTSLPVDVQLIFTYGVCKTDKGYPHQMKCLESLDSLSEMGADFGYIVTPETRTDVEVSVENLCFNLFPIVFPSGPGQNGTHSSPEDGVSGDGGEDEDKEADGSILDRLKWGETGSIIGIAIAAAACLLCFFIVACRRRFHNNGGKASRELRTDGPESPVTSVDQIIVAIDEANWDKVYNLAQLAERGYLVKFSSIGKGHRHHVKKRRQHLSTEDQGRARTLDQLVKSKNWIGLAVTAALYADEIGSSNENSTSAKRNFPDVIYQRRTLGGYSSRGLDQREDSMEKAVIRSDWGHASPLSPEVERIGAFQENYRPGTHKSVPNDIESDHLPVSSGRSQTRGDSLFLSLVKAAEDGDWAQVAYFADEIGESGDVPNKALVASSSSESGTSLTTPNDPKRQTILKLIESEKWEGVKIMAGIYESASPSS